MKKLKKTGLIFLLIGLVCAKAQAQFLGGFFSQQSNKEKLMAEQIAGYQILLNGLKKGYQITESGLNAAHEIKDGTFGLHIAYFNSLEQIDPIVQDNPKGRAIADLRRLIVSLFNAEVSWQQHQKLLSADELEYLGKVYANVLRESENDMAELTMVLTPGKLQLTDQQRIGRIDHIYSAMKDKYAFTGYFTDKCRKLAKGRQQNKQENDQLRMLYGIH